MGRHTMISAIQVAQYLLALAHSKGDQISNLKLQKLLYYLQGFSLVVNNKPLFPEPIEAWTHGPVVASVYHKYSKYGNNHIPAKEGDRDILDKDVQEFIDEVYSEYGRYSAWKLRQMTHMEPPWKDAYRVDVSGVVITHKAMIDYFSQFVSQTTIK